MRCNHDDATMKRILPVFAFFFTVTVQGQEYGQESTPTVGNEIESSSSTPSSVEDSPDVSISEQEMMKEMTSQLSRLVSVLATIRDEKTAASVAGEIEVMMDRLFAIDYANFEGVNEEEVAASLADLFNDLELQVSRLFESNFFGNEVLIRVFGEDDEQLMPPPGKDEEEPDDESELQLTEPD